MTESRPAIFLDRDGVINVEKSYITKPEQLVLYPKSAEAIKKLNDAGYLCIVVTNQSAVARDLCTEADLTVIHDRLKRLLKKENAVLDAIYYCPHYPHDIDGVNPKYLKDCDCRKPKSGLIGMACNDFNIDLSASYLVGDTERDILCGQDKAVFSIGVKTGNALGGKPEIADYFAESLFDAVTFILNRK